MLLLAAACGPGAADEGYVLLDAQARRAGFALEVDGEGRSTPLPVAVTVGDGDAPVLAGPERREVIDIAPGELIHIRGEEAALERGVPDLDKLRVRTDEASARSFAARLGITPAADGPSRWRLEGRDVFLMASLLEDADAKGLFSSAPFFVSREVDRRRADPSLLDAREAARASEDSAQGDAFTWRGPDPEDEALRAFFAARANGTAARSPEELARDRAEIERDLAVTLTAPGRQASQTGERISLAVSLENRGLRERWVVRPRDGSEMGWREPYVYYTVEREVSRGAWAPAPKAPFSRCGNYAYNWEEDVVAVPPGGSIPLGPEMLPIYMHFDLRAGGRYRITAHYEYGAGVGRRGLFGSGAMDRLPDELDGVPAFEVVSAPLVIAVAPAAAESPASDEAE